MLRSVLLLSLLVAVQCASNSTRYGTDLLSLIVSDNDTFELQVENKTWLQSYDIGVRCGGTWTTTKPGPNQLHLDALDYANGETNWGSFRDVHFYWSSPTVGTSWDTVFRFYAGLSIVVFTQVFWGCNDMAAVTGDTYKDGILEVSSAFPTFKVKGRDASLPTLNYLTFSLIGARSVVFGMISFLVGHMEVYRSCFLMTRIMLSFSVPWTITFSRFCAE